MRFLRVVMVYAFDPLLPGVCLHASCHILFLGLLVPFFVFNSFIFRIILLFLLLLVLRVF